MKEGDEDYTVMRIKINGIEDGQKVCYTYNLLDSLPIIQFQWRGQRFYLYSCSQSCFRKKYIKLEYLLLSF